MVDSAGGRTQLSMLITTLIVLLVLLFLTEPLAYLPDAVLSAVVFLIGIELIDVKGMSKIFAQRRSEFWVAMITALMVVFVGVEQGIILSIILSLIDHTRRGYRPKNAILLPTPQGGLRSLPISSKAQAMDGLIIYRFTHSMYYANAQKLSKEITYLVNNSEPPLRWFCIDMSAVDDIDYSATETLRSLYASLNSKGVHMIIAQVLDDLKQSHKDLFQLFGQDAFFDSLSEVMKTYQHQNQHQPGA
jgi:MFS superfamily sulfate permease-like transporter